MLTRRFAILAAGLGMLACRRQPALPAFRPLPPEAFRVEWLGTDAPGRLRAGQSYDIRVSFRNISPVAWPNRQSTGAGTGAGAVRLAYRWWSAAAPIPVVDYSDDRTELTRALRPGEALSLTVRVKAPPAPDDYELQFDLCQELVAWFEARGAERLERPVRVE